MACCVSLAAENRVHGSGYASNWGWCNCHGRALPNKPRSCLVVLSRSVRQLLYDQNDAALITSNKTDVKLRTVDHDVLIYTSYKTDMPIIHFGRLATAIIPMSLCPTMKSLLFQHPKTVVSIYPTTFIVEESDLVQS
jgi:hypothetical protein